MRAIGTLEMSVGTSLAFEGSLVTNLGRTDSLLLNLRTLVRNAQQAYEKDDKEKLDADQIQRDTESDLSLIAKWLEVNRKGKPVSMTVYNPSYSDLAKRFPNAKIWGPTTDLQKKTEKLIDDVVKAIVRKYSKLILSVGSTLPDFKGNGIVLTHHVVDLVDAQGAGRLQLLESYTGLLKGFTLWHTKLTGGSELHYIPFNRLTIQIFGDKSTNFGSSSHAIKELVKKIATEGHWTSASSLSRVRGTINNWPVAVDKAGLLMMM